MKLILFFFRRLLALRYRINLSWVEKLKHDWPILILPNHVALVDPVIMISFLWKYLKVSPLASEKYYNKPVLKQIMNIVWTVPIWEMSEWSNSDDVKKAFRSITKALNDGKNILIYPSGQIYRQWCESIKWKQSVYNVVQNMPKNTKVIWIRDRWLWWSIWSKAWDNWETSLWKALLKSIQYIFANFVFFIPKRNLSIDIEDITEQIKLYKNKNLNVFNVFLEEFYNNPESIPFPLHSEVLPLKKEEIKELQNKYIEPISYLKHYFYYDDVKWKNEPDVITGSEEDLGKSNNYNLTDITDDVKNKIKEKIMVIKEIKINDNLSQPSFNIKGKSKNIINSDSKLVLDLFFDSLDLAEIKSFVQWNFPWASNPPITDLKTVADLYVMAVWKSHNQEKLKDCDWGREKKIGWLLVEKL